MTAGRRVARRERPGRARAGFRPPRISSNCRCACICCVNSVAWIPWKSPSSQPTSCACAMRSSLSLGVSLLNGNVTSSSSWRRSGDRISSSSWIERSWISFSARRPASSSGARRASSSSERTIDAIRMSLVGRATCSPASAFGGDLVEDLGGERLGRLGPVAGGRCCLRHGHQGYPSRPRARPETRSPWLPRSVREAFGTQDFAASALRAE